MRGIASRDGQQCSKRNQGLELLQFKRRTNSEENRKYIKLWLQVYQREIA
jgi:hypothetical protein